MDEWPPPRSALAAALSGFEVEEEGEEQTWDTRSPTGAAGAQNLSQYMALRILL